MDWSDDGIVIATRRHGETSVIAELLTRDHGRHAGLVRGGTSRRQTPMLQPGNTVAAKWRGRLEEHLGTYTLELEKSRAASLMSNRLALAGLNAACAVALVCLPEREPHVPLFEALTIVLDAMDDNEVWPALYVKWELGLLRDLGFGLDFSHCAATGVTENLTYLSPKSGKAVSQAAAEPFKARLLPIPAFLRPGDALAAPTTQDIVQGLEIGAYFIERRLLRVHGIPLPEARLRLIDALKREGGG